MKKASKLLFGAVIVSILLAIYIYTMVFLILAVINKVDSGDSVSIGIRLSEEFIMVLTTVSGLVSALVISELTSTRIVGETTAEMLLQDGASNTQKSAAHYLTYIYVWIWIIIGAAAFSIGVIMYPDVSSTLKEAGTTWFGLLVAIGYSFFGIQKKG
jgi:hypothetical protein